MFLLISETCPMLHAQVFLQSRYLPPPHLPLSSMAATRSGEASALPSLSSPEGPSEPHKALHEAGPWLH